MFSQMGGAANPQHTRRKRVYFEGTGTIYEGMPVCYNFDTTDNILGYSTSSAAKGTTTAEGSQNEGKYVRVELPANNNLLHFAGVVCAGEWVMKTGPKWLDIFVPNGAIVPVRCDVDTTVGVTILSMTVGEEELGQLVADSRPIAIAMETETGLDGTAGITLAKLDPNMFLYQTLDSTTLHVGAGTENLGAINHTQVESAQTGGYLTNYLVQVNITGALVAAGGACGVCSVLTLSGGITAGGYTRSLLGITALSGTINAGNSFFVGGHFQVGGAPVLTEVSHLAAIWGDCGISTDQPTTGQYEVLYLSNNGAARLNQMVYMYGNSGASSGSADYIWRFDSLYFGGAVDTPIRDGGTGDTTIDTGGDWKKIRINIDGTDYWMVAFTNPSES